MEYIDGHVMVMYLFQVSRTQQQGIALIGLINSPSGIPCVPLYFIRKQYNDKLSLNFMTYLASINYKVKPTVTLEDGYSFTSLVTKRNWVRGADGKDYMINRNYFSPQVGILYQPCKTVMLSAHAGYRVCIRPKLFDKCAETKILELEKKGTPFITGKASVRF